MSKQATRLSLSESIISASLIAIFAFTLCEMSSKRKFNTLSLSKKVDVIEAIRNGTKKEKDIAIEFGISTSTLSIILKNMDDIMKRSKSCDNWNIKRKRAAEFPDIEECLVKWFKQCRDSNVSIGGPIIQKKAEFFAKSLGHNDFKASNGWLEKFKKRHNIVSEIMR